MKIANMGETVARFEAYLKKVLPLSDMTVREAMEYSLAAGGKRLRPYLMMEFCRICGGDAGAVLPLAAALEMIHTYSLIHDDLPCMDNDDYRRGKLTNHKVYGEAMATLAGDGLLTEAFRVALTAPLPPERIVACTAELAKAAGLFGMLGGQSIDVESEKQRKTLSIEEMREMYAMKTGALIRAACVIGAMAAGAGEREKEGAAEYGEKLGIAFQIVDDILDVTGDFATLGKEIGSDARNEKATFATVMSLEEARKEAALRTSEAVFAAWGFPLGKNLAELATAMLDRDK